jgi:ribonuclease J
LKKENRGKLKIIPLGGLEQIGMNITAFEYEDSIIVVDCGLAFPEDDMLGIDLVIPDVTYLKDNISKVKGSPMVMKIISELCRMYLRRSIFQSILQS